MTINGEGAVSGIGGFDQHEHAVQQPLEVQRLMMSKGR